MRNIENYIVIFFMMTIGIGCSGFLDEYSQDEIVPSTADDLEQLMVGEAYPIITRVLSYLDLLTDDVNSNYPSVASQTKALITGAAVFTWQSDMYEQMAANTTTAVNTWEYYYSRIMGCNVVLDNIDAVIGDKGKKSNVKGQALAMRAYYYFMLVNLYAKPYNAEGIDRSKELGVPLILSSAVKDDFPRRATMAQVYSQIEKDLLEAVPLMDEHGQNNNLFKANDLLVHNLLSRLYLYQEKWEQVIKQADYVIGRSPILLNLSDVVMADGRFSWMTGTGVFDPASPECIWRYSSANEFDTFFYPYSPPVAYEASQELKDLYGKDNAGGLVDLRKECYYRTYAQGTQRIIQSGKKAITGNSKGMRVAEAYLNRAEANIRLYLKNNDEESRKAALKDLNYLRSCRFDTRTEMYQDVDKRGNSLLEFYMDERRRELTFEEHRWFDLRRYGMPEITHVLTLEAGQPVTHVLEAKSSKYVLPIPQYILDRNPNLEPNF